MSRRHGAGRRAVAIAVTASLVLLSLVFAGASTAAADPSDPSVPSPASPVAIPGHHQPMTPVNRSKLTGALQGSTGGVHSVFVELAGESAEGGVA